MDPGTSDGKESDGGMVRRFARFELRELLGRSDRTMAWRAYDPMVEAERMLVLPRVVPSGPGALAAWEVSARLAARLDHPHLVRIAEVGSHEGWPFQAYNIADLSPLSQTMDLPNTLSVRQVAALVAEASRGLAFAHEAGVIHGDVEPYLFFLAESGHARVAGLAACSLRNAAGALAASAAEGADLELLRSAARDDLVALGLLMQWLLAGKPALEEPDISRARGRIAPLGKEFARLPPVLATQVPEPLRAIANRATDRHERRRYQNARTLQAALEGWLQSDSDTGAGAMELILQKVAALGLLPAMPEAQERVGHLALMEQQQVSALAEVVLEDIGLTFEMLRAVNQAQSQEPRLAGAPPILTVRRALAMLGMDGVRRASRALREWPGPLDEDAAQALEAVMERCRCAARVAQALRPVGYDAEIVFVVTLLQNLGRLVAHFHFPEECAQIARLVHPPPPEEPDQEQDPGMSEQAASYAVLGLDLDTIGTEVARYCGLSEATVASLRRVPPTAPVHPPQSDDEALRLTASCANEAMDMLQMRPPQAATALSGLVLRYAKALKLTTETLRDALTLNGMSDEIETLWLGRRRGRAVLR